MKENLQKACVVFGVILIAWVGVAWYGKDKSNLFSEVSGASGASPTTTSVRASSSISSKPALPAPKLNPISVSSYEAVHGKEAHSVVVVNKKRMELTSNIAGEFPRVQVKPKETIPVRVTFPGGDPGDFVMIEAKDGGHLENRKIVKPTALDAKRGVDFEFTTNQEEGVYRVLVRRGSDQRLLDFWVGEPIPVRQ